MRASEPAVGELGQQLPRGFAFNAERLNPWSRVSHVNVVKDANGSGSDGDTEFGSEFEFGFFGSPAVSLLIQSLLPENLFWVLSVYWHYICFTVLKEKEVLFNFNLKFI